MKVTVSFGSEDKVYEEVHGAEWVDGSFWIIFERKEIVLPAHSFESALINHENHNPESMMLTGLRKESKGKGGSFTVEKKSEDKAGWLDKLFNLF